MMGRSAGTFGSLGAVLALTLCLAACETATPYQPLATTNAVDGGFTDKRLDDTHFRVTFQGNALTSREQVDNYLLYRAAELTVQNGFDWFEMIDRNTHDQSTAFVVGDGYWSPAWRVHGHWGWGVWAGNFGPYDNADFESVDRYEAVADIGVGRGTRPADDTRAFDARQVMQNLSAQIVRPAATK
jgi:hypothetical protein